MERKFRVLEEDTGCETKLLQAFMDKHSAYLNVEVPNPELSAEGDRNLSGSAVNVNLAINYGPGTGISKRTALSRLKKARESFEMATQIRGLYGGEFNEEEPGTIADFGFVEQVYSLFCNKSPTELQTILNRIESVTDDLAPKSKMGSQLEQLFAGKVDERTLEGLTKDVDAEMERVTLQTGSTGVVKFTSRGNIGYGKVASDLKALENEQKAINNVRSNGITRVLAPVPIGLALDEKAGALFTWGTENASKYSREDVENYFSVFNTFLFSYAQANKLNLRELARDKTMQDVFNLALIHSSGIKFEADYERPLVVELGELEERSGKNNEFRKLREYNNVYEEASKRALNLNPGKQVFVHGDARPENIGKDPFGVRPFVDWANAHMGYASSELASLEAKDTRKYATWYNFIMNLRGGQVLDKEGQELISCFDILQPYRTASFKIGKGRIVEAQRDLRRLERNSRLYLEHFKK